MTARRTVTVQTSDHGPVTLPEPEWCLGNHEASGYRADLSHTGPEHALAYDDETLLVASLTQDPYATHGPRTPGLYVEQTGYARTLTPEETELLADALVGHAAELRVLARKLAALGEGQ
ncbi:hypothetical protein [Streptomyces sp. NPDC048442]|uniref:DUF6907 domain-containing protein n=1 Tax=Streptomyces sp. NPDC048442 TaxID=3154823 RepID=UPI0034193C70